MRSKLFNLGILVGVLLAGGCSDALGPAKDFKVVPLDNQAEVLTLADCKGKTILLDFWATYCGPCKDSMPEIQAVWDKYRAKGFDVVSISSEPRPLVLGFHRAMPFTYPIYIDPNNVVSKSYGVDSIPHFLLIRDGKVIWEQVGYQRGDIAQNVAEAMG